MKRYNWKDRPLYKYLKKTFKPSHLVFFGFLKLGFFWFKPLDLNHVVFFAISDFKRPNPLSIVFYDCRQPKAYSNGWTDEQ